MLFLNFYTEMFITYFYYFLLVAQRETFCFLIFNLFKYVLILYNTVHKIKLSIYAVAVICCSLLHGHQWETTTIYLNKIVFGRSKPVARPCF